MLSSPSIDDIFNSIPFRMEQHPVEIRQFAEWLYQRRWIVNTLEIGVRHGGTSALWHGLSSGMTIGVDYGGIDGLGEKGTIELSIKMRETLGNRYNFVYGDSHLQHTKDQIVDILGGRLLDLLFIDGDHSYDGVSMDYNMYKGLVKSGGCIAFHDIVDSDFMKTLGHGVWKFWRELRGVKVEFCIDGDWGGIGVLVV